MKEQILFIGILWKNLEKSISKYLSGSDGGKQPYNGGVFMDKNCSKTVLKRKITMLRQELLNLERMLDDV